MTDTEKIREWLDECGEIEMLNDAVRDSLAQKLAEFIDRDKQSRDQRLLDMFSGGPPVQESDPRCRNCGGFTTYARVSSHGLCMRCENDRKIPGSV